ncbi:hypothetical protein LZ32DRAFT_374118 [Colletotrichum eremochloae]|nr:hypothetical protein LZ32DRAFT_374118 [Colletotrichum eremochloae]
MTNPCNCVAHFFQSHLFIVMIIAWLFSARTTPYSLLACPDLHQNLKRRPRRSTQMNVRMCCPPVTQNCSPTVVVARKHCYFAKRTLSGAAPKL